MKSDGRSASEGMRTWETVGGENVVHVMRSGVVVASGWGFSECGTSCSLQDFLDGECNDTVEQIFGKEILEEVRAAARSLMGKEEYAAWEAKVSAHRAYLESIPLDESLKVFADKSNHEDRGDLHWNKGGEFRSGSGTVIPRCTRLSGKNATLVLGYANIIDNKPIESPRPVAYLVSTDLALERPVESSPSAGGIAYDGFFFLCFGYSFGVLSEAGERVEREKDRQMFGGMLRIARVARIKDRVCFGYYWFNREGPDGYLLFSPSERTFTARWEET